RSDTPARGSGARRRRTRPLPRPARQAQSSAKRSVCKSWPSSSLDDFRRDENEQLRALLVERVALEQPAEQGDAADAWRPIVRRLLLADVDAADDRRLAV